MYSNAFVSLSFELSKCSWIFQISVDFLLGKSAKLPYSVGKFRRDIGWGCGSQPITSIVQVCFADKVRVKHTVGR